MIGKLRISIVDYQTGNIFSLQNALRQHGVEATLTRDTHVLRDSDAIILPGVGSFECGMNNLRYHGLIPVIQELSETKPILGICLGMQLLFDKGFEGGDFDGLGIIPGSVVKLDVNGRLPHIGWNRLAVIDKSPESLLAEVGADDEFYFCHSYVPAPTDPQAIGSTTRYAGSGFCSSIRVGRIYGVQFHPEKSRDQGLRVLRLFLNHVGN